MIIRWNVNPDPPAPKSTFLTTASWDSFTEFPVWTPFHPVLHLPRALLRGGVHNLLGGGPPLKLEAICNSSFGAAGPREPRAPRTVLLASRAWEKGGSSDLPGVGGSGVSPHPWETTTWVFKVSFEASSAKNVVSLPNGLLSSSRTPRSFL